MRPVAKTQSATEFPLNAILGTEANVRILRALYLNASSLSGPQIAAQAALSNAGAARASTYLVEAGALDVVGSGRSRQYRLRRRHPLMPAIEALFEAEADRTRRLDARLRTLFSDLDPSPIAAHNDTDQRLSGGLNQPMRIEVIARSSDVDVLRSNLRPRIAEIEREFDAIIELAVVSQNDVRLSQGQPLFKPLGKPYFVDFSSAGPTPKASRAKQGSNHQAHDAAQLRGAKVLANLIRKDPSLISKAARSLEQRILREDRPASDLSEWLTILQTNSPPQIAALLESQSDRGTQLRQTPVFVEVLSVDERESIKRAMREGEE